MKRKKNLLSSIRLLLVSLLLICFLPFNLSNFSNSDIRFETDLVKEQVKSLESDVSGVQSDALPLTDLEPSFTAQITKQSHSSTCQSYTIAFKITPADNATVFTLGYYGQDDLDLPFSVQYQVKTEENETETRVYNIANQNKNGNYQAMGPGFKNEDSFTFDILINPGEKIITESLIFFNIFTIARSENVDPETGLKPYVPGTQPYYIDTFTFSALGKIDVDLEQYISVELSNISTFLGYASITAVIDNNSIPLYEEQMQGRSDFKTNQDRLASGKFRYDYQFKNMNDSFILLYLEDGNSKRIPISDGNALSSAFRINEGKTTIHLLVKGVDFSGVVGLSLCSCDFNIGLVNKESLSDINTANLPVRLGSLYFNIEEGKSIEYINIGMILLITLLAFSALYIIGIFVAYFYFSNKYKNDEFKRVDPKRFFKINILGYLAATVLLMDIMIICFRSLLLGSELAMFNPLDNYIVCLSIIGILFIGYFIKYFVNNIKAYLERKAVNKLQLDKDKADDGTN